MDASMGIAQNALDALPAGSVNDEDSECRKEETRGEGAMQKSDHQSDISERLHSRAAHTSDQASNWQRELVGSQPLPPPGPPAKLRTAACVQIVPRAESSRIALSSRIPLCQWSQCEGRWADAHPHVDSSDGPTWFGKRDLPSGGAQCPK